MTGDEHYMARCLQLARTGRDGVPPNPMVGAVVVCKGRIIGEGCHRRYGGHHAEVNALRSVTEEILLPESTLYVNLEPCSHTGKTPPCANLIIEKKIPRVVVGCLDTNPLVHGKGTKRLREAGVEVITGVLEKECRTLNRRFFTVQEKERPYIVLKWAQSKEGMIDRLRRSADEGSPVIFSTPCTQMLVHRLRSKADAVMVGHRTALLDDPALTVRCWPGRNPVRIVTDRRLTLPPALRLMDGKVASTWVVTEAEPPANIPQGIEYIRLNFGENILPPLMSRLLERGIQSLLIEGGSRLLQSFIDCNLWDEAHVECSPLSLAQGVPAPVIGHFSEQKNDCSFGRSFLHYYR